MIRILSIRACFELIPTGCFARIRCFEFIIAYITRVGTVLIWKKTLLIESENSKIVQFGSHYEPRERRLKVTKIGYKW